MKLRIAETETRYWYSDILCRATSCNSSSQPLMLTFKIQKSCDLNLKCILSTYGNNGKYTIKIKNRSLQFIKEKEQRMLHLQSFIVHGGLNRCAKQSIQVLLSGFRNNLHSEPIIRRIGKCQHLDQRLQVCNKENKTSSQTSQHKIINSTISGTRISMLQVEITGHVTFRCICFTKVVVISNSQKGSTKQ